MNICTCLYLSWWLVNKSVIPLFWCYSQWNVASRILYEVKSVCPPVCPPVFLSPNLLITSQRLQYRCTASRLANCTGTDMIRVSTLNACQNHKYSCLRCFIPPFLSWDSGRSWKGIKLIRSLSTEKTVNTLEKSVIFKNYQINQKYGYFGTFWTFSQCWTIGSNRFLFMSDQRLMAQV